AELPVVPTVTTGSVSSAITGARGVGSDSAAEAASRARSAGAAAGRVSPPRQDEPRPAATKTKARAKRCVNPAFMMDPPPYPSLLRVFIDPHPLLSASGEWAASAAGFTPLPLSRLLDESVVGPEHAVLAPQRGHADHEREPGEALVDEGGQRPGVGGRPQDEVRDHEEERARH